MGRVAQGSAIAATILACAAAAAPTTQSTSPSPTDTTRPGNWVRRVDGITVSDSAGTPYRFPFLGGLDRPRPQLVDIDGDGDLDLFIQEFSTWMMFFERDDSAGTRRYIWRSDRYADLPVGEWSRFADIDGDGDLDLFAEEPYSLIRYYRNVGTPQAARWTMAGDTLKDERGEPVFADRQNIPQLADIDCDGRLDLLLGRVDGTVTRYDLPPAGSAEPQLHFVTNNFQGIQIVGQTFGSLHGANTMAVVDLDGDGDPDILWGDFFERGLLWIVNDGSCARPSLGGTPVQFPPAAPISTSGYNAPFPGDIDSDGDLDLLVGVLGGAYGPSADARENLYLLEQTGRQQWSLTTKRFLTSIDVGSESVPALVDLDGDGDLDLVLGNKLSSATGHATLTIFTNTGSTSAPRFRQTDELSLAESFQFAPAFGDLDGDGDADLALGSWQDHVRYYRNDGGTFVLADSSLVKLTRGSHTAPTLGDVDGDGDLDLMVGESSGALNYYRNDGTRTAPRFTLVSDNFQGIDPGRRSAPAFADLNGDGKLDLAVGSENGQISVYLNTGKAGDVPEFALDASATIESQPLAAPAFGDIDGDGDLDLIAGSSSGGVVWMERR